MNGNEWKSMRMNRWSDTEHDTRPQLALPFLIYKRVWSHSYCDEVTYFLDKPNFILRNQGSRADHVLGLLLHKQQSVTLA